VICKLDGSSDKYKLGAVWLPSPVPKPSIIDFKCTHVQSHSLNPLKDKCESYKTKNTCNAANFCKFNFKMDSPQKDKECSDKKIGLFAGQTLSSCAALCYDFYQTFEKTDPKDISPESPMFYKIEGVANGNECKRRCLQLPISECISADFTATGGVCVLMPVNIDNV